MSNGIFDYLKKKIKIIISSTLLIAIAFAVISVVMSKTEEIYEKENIYLINYENDDKEASIENENNSSSINTDNKVVYSQYMDIVKIIIHSDNAYEKINSNTKLDLTKKQYDSMLWEEFSDDGRLLTLNIRHHDGYYCEAVGKEISNVIDKLLEEKINANADALVVNTPITETTGLTSEEIKHLVDGLGHSYKEKSITDMVTIGIKNFTIFGVAVLIGIILIFSIRYYFQLLKRETKY